MSSVTVLKFRTACKASDVINAVRNKILRDKVADCLGKLLDTLSYLEDFQRTLDNRTSQFIDNEAVSTRLLYRKNDIIKTDVECLKNFREAIAEASYALELPDTKAIWVRRSAPNLPALLEIADKEVNRISDKYPDSFGMF